jgi:galactose-1-phosphate uridylyltransferase
MIEKNFNSYLSYKYRIIYETENFFSVPTLGQIVKGYSLIFSKQKINNFTSLNLNSIEEFDQIINKIVLAIKQKYSNPIIFEHGAIQCNSNISCGTNRAHLHIAPTEINLILKELFNKYELYNIYKNIYEFIQSNKDINFPYILITNLNSSCYIFKYGSKKESQVIRKALWKNTKSNIHWNWKKYPTKKLTYSTYKELKEIL